MKKSVGALALVLASHLALAQSLDCELFVQKTTLHDGDSIEVRVTLTNITDSTLYLLGNIDGASSKWRHPYCYFVVLNAQGDTINPATRSCSNFDFLRPEHFVGVAPNESFDPHRAKGSWPAYFPSTADLSKGRYQIRFIYSTEAADFAETAMPKRDRRWGKTLPNEEELKRLWLFLPKETVMSNWIEIEVN